MIFWSEISGERFKNLLNAGSLRALLRHIITEMKAFVVVLLLSLLALVRGSGDAGECNNARKEYNDCTRK